MFFDDGTFDVAWSQHVIMNIEDKSSMFSEVKRVLRPGGRFSFFEVCAGSLSPPHYPMPWASDASINFLVQPNELQKLLVSTGFDEIKWRDISASSLAWFQAVSARRKAHPDKGPPPLGLHLLMGKTSAQKFANIKRNLAEDRIRVIQAVYGR